MRAVETAQTVCAFVANVLVLVATFYKTWTAYSTSKRLHMSVPITDHLIKNGEFSLPKALPAVFCSMFVIWDDIGGSYFL